MGLIFPCECLLPDAPLPGSGFEGSEPQGGADINLQGNSTYILDLLHVVCTVVLCICSAFRWMEGFAETDFELLSSADDRSHTHLCLDLNTRLPPLKYEKMMLKLTTVFG